MQAQPSTALVQQPQNEHCSGNNVTMRYWHANILDMAPPLLKVLRFNIFMACLCDILPAHVQFNFKPQITAPMLFQTEEVRFVTFNPS